MIPSQLRNNRFSYFFLKGEAIGRQWALAPPRQLQRLAVADETLGNIINLKLVDITSVENAKVQELFPCIWYHMDDSFGNSLMGNDLKVMQLDLSHSLSWYELKFSADKVDYLMWTLFQFAYKGQTIPSSKMRGIDNPRIRWILWSINSKLITALILSFVSVNYPTVNALESRGLGKAS